MDIKSEVNITIRRWFHRPLNVKQFMMNSEIHYRMHEPYEQEWVYAFYLKNKLIGYAYVEQTDENHLYLYEFEIHPNYRMQGYGRRILRDIQKKYRKIDVNATSSSVKFWRKNGFKAWDKKEHNLLPMSNY